MLSGSGVSPVAMACIDHEFAGGRNRGERANVIMMLREAATHLGSCRSKQRQGYFCLFPTRRRHCVTVQGGSEACRRQRVGAEPLRSGPVPTLRTLGPVEKEARRTGGCNIRAINNATVSTSTHLPTTSWPELQACSRHWGPGRGGSCHCRKRHSCVPSRGQDLRQRPPKGELSGP